VGFECLVMQSKQVKLASREKRRSLND